MTYQKGIRDARAWRNGALRDTTWPVHVIGIDLVDAMEMQTGGLIAEFIVQVDNNDVAHSGLDLWTGPGSVDANDGSRKAIRARCDPGDIPIVCDRARAHERSEL